MEQVTVPHGPSQPALKIRLFDAEDGYVGAECLDIPGCISQGKTREEALTNIMDAISVCMEVILDRAARAIHEQAPASNDLTLSLSTSELTAA